MITQKTITVNVFTSDKPKWIAVIKGGKAELVRSTHTECIHDIIEADTKEALTAELKKQKIAIKIDPVIAVK